MSRIPSGDNRGLDAYEHVAVIVAEDITSRFLNVISLLNKTIPLIAIQLRTLDVGGVLTINATTVLDLVRLGTEEEVEPGQATDWNHWVGPGSKASVSLADDMLVLVNEIVPGVDLQYNKHYIGLARDGVANNFVTFRARKERLLAEFESRAETRSTHLSMTLALTAFRMTSAGAATAFALHGTTSSSIANCFWS